MSVLELLLLLIFLFALLILFATLMREVTCNGAGMLVDARNVCNERGIHYLFETNLINTRQTLLVYRFVDGLLCSAPDSVTRF